MKSKKGQGTVEYLFFIGLAILVTIVVFNLFSRVKEWNQNEFVEDWVCSKEIETGRSECVTDLINPMACTKIKECVEWVWTKTKVVE